jgi:hypothetical protein
MLLSHACLVMRLATDLSSSLFNVSKRLMGLYEPGSCGGLFGLGIAKTKACFHLAGKNPSRKIELKIYVRYVTAYGVKFRIIMLHIPSSPGADLGFSFRILFTTSVRVMCPLTLMLFPILWLNSCTSRSTSFAWRLCCGGTPIHAWSRNV